MTSQPPLSPKVAVYVPLDNPVKENVFVPLPTVVPELFLTVTVGEPDVDESAMVTVLLLIYPFQVPVPDALVPYNETEYVDVVDCPICAEKLVAVPLPVVLVDVFPFAQVV